MTASLLSMPVDQYSGSRESLHVLTLTPFYPVSEDDARGCFVSEPLEWIKPLGVTNTVLGVQPFYRGRVPCGQAGIPGRWIHFFTLPRGIGLPTAGAFLFGGLLSEI